MILVTAVSLGRQPALSGDAVKDVQPSAIAGRVRPLDFVKSSVSHVLTAVQSRPAAGSESGSAGPRFAGWRVVRSACFRSLVNSSPKDDVRWFLCCGIATGERPTVADVHWRLRPGGTKVP